MLTGETALFFTVVANHGTVTLLPLLLLAGGSFRNQWISCEGHRVFFSHFYSSSSLWLEAIETVELVACAADVTNVCSFLSNCRLLLFTVSAMKQSKVTLALMMPLQTKYHLTWSPVRENQVFIRSSESNLSVCHNGFTSVALRRFVPAELYQPDFLNWTHTQARWSDDVQWCHTLWMTSLYVIVGYNTNQLLQCFLFGAWQTG